MRLHDIVVRSPEVRLPQDEEMITWRRLREIVADLERRNVPQGAYIAWPDTYASYVLRGMMPAGGSGRIHRYEDWVRDSEGT